ncbi:helix-turn-helix domain-containing protein [Myroides odoratus]
MTIKQAINNRFTEAVEHLVNTKRVRSKAKIAQSLGIGPNTLSEIKGGRVNASIEVIINFCDLYDISLLYVLKGETTIEDSMNYLTVVEASKVVGCSISTFKKFYADKLKRFKIKNNPKEILFDKEEVLTLKKELTNA